MRTCAVFSAFPTDRGSIRSRIRHSWRPNTPDPLAAPSYRARVKLVRPERVRISAGESAVTSSCHWNVSIITTYLSALPPPHARAAIHRQRHAGNETGFVGSEKQRGVGDVPPGSHLFA